MRVLQKQASSLVADLSSSLLAMDISQEDGGDDVLNAAIEIVQVDSNLLEFSSNVSNVFFHFYLYQLNCRNGHCPS